jgi:hypothetical protein
MSPDGACRFIRSLAVLSCLLLAVANPPTLSSQEASIRIERGPGPARLEFEGSLQSSTNLTGPFATVAGASSPYLIDPSSAVRRYWRTRNRDIAGDPNRLAQTICAAAYYSVAIQEDHQMWAWPLSGSMPNPAPLMPSMRWNAVSSVGPTGHTLAIDTQGELWSWGSNRGGELGIGAVFSTTNAPQHVMPGTRWVWASAAPGVSLAIRNDGSLWSWGTNRFHRLGDDIVDSRTSPGQVGTGTGWVRVAAGNQHVLATRSDGTLWAWGANASGQLGSGTKADRIAPEPLEDPGPWVSVSASPTLSVAVKADGTLWWWGTRFFVADS